MTPKRPAALAPSDHPRPREITSGHARAPFEPPRRCGAIGLATVYYQRRTTGVRDSRLQYRKTPANDFGGLWIALSLFPTRRGR
jgi:hypothetical protein